MELKPFVSIIIPVKELTYYLLFETLPAIEKQSYKKFEVIVLPNKNSLYDLTLFKKYKWLKILPTGKIIKPAEKRDIGANKAVGEIFAFLDDDAYPEKDWLNNGVLLFKKKIAAICGPGVLPNNSDFLEKTFDEVLKTWIGSGGYNYRFIPQKARYVDDYPSMNFLILKKYFLKLGGFNNDYWPGEDSKLCEDLVYKERQKILYHPNLIVFHHRRKNIASYLKQHANYGFHRGAFFAHGDRNSRRFGYLIPSFFVIYLFFITFISISQLTINNYQLPIIFFPLITYLLFEIYLFVKSLFNTGNILIALASVSVLFLTHLVYGIKFMHGFMVGMIKKEKIYG